ncbi:MAG: isochorismatase family protein [Planctomycetes bacterium]|nr:isochorismatase family protein [Planctomycetota bacterium]
MARALLITQCLQNDFVGPLAPHDPLPNKLHVGWEEAQRLLGHDPRGGPVAQLMNWAREQAAEGLSILHIRDAHDPADARQRDHLARFGPHCLAGTPGAALVLGLDEGRMGRANEQTLDSIALSDFEDTDLLRRIEELRGAGGDSPLRVGVVGVWTEAKVSFLLYDLKARGRIDELATCSALTASASRTQHFIALEQVQKILGVRCFDTVGDFVEWLLPGGQAIRPPPLPFGFGPRIEVPEGHPPIAEEDLDLLGYLYRDSSRVELQPLSGGFSGASVFRVASRDAVGHEQAPSVAKLGPRELVGKERVAFERVEAVLGNNAPNVRGFADLGRRAGIKYAYAAMGQGQVRSLKSLFEGGCAQARIDAILRTVFEEILGRVYGAAQWERLPLLDHYGFSPKFAPSVRRKVEGVVGAEAAGRERLRFGRDGSFEVQNVCRFYETELAGLLERAGPGAGEFRFVSYVHGDLNGANILVDARENVWVIDFFHTQRGHVLRDLAKLENDLCYLFTPVADEAALEEGLAITRALARVEDLRTVLGEVPEGVTSAPMVRAWDTLRTLRGIVAVLCRTDREPLQMEVALLRYAAHTLSFDEATAAQKRWALAAACAHAEAVTVACRRRR